MNRQELLETLGREGIRDDAYNLEGVSVDETLTLGEADGRWFVYYSERGMETGKKEFATETEACAYLLNILREDPTVRINAPKMTPQKLFEILRKERIREASGRWFVAWTDPPRRAKRRSLRLRAKRASTFGVS